MEGNVWVTAVMWVVGIVVLLVIAGLSIGIPYLFIRMILKQIEYAKTIKDWALDLKKRHTSQGEFDTLLQEMRDVKWVPNRPEYWGYCKNIYYATLHSREITLDQKRQLYTEFERMKVHGLPYPQERKNVR